MSAGNLETNESGRVAETVTALPASGTFSESPLTRTPPEALSVPFVAPLIAAAGPGASATDSLAGLFEQPENWLPASQATLDSRLPVVGGGQFLLSPQLFEQTAPGDTADQQGNDDALLALIADGFTADNFDVFLSELEKSA